MTTEEIDAAIDARLKAEGYPPCVECGVQLGAAWMHDQLDTDAPLCGSCKRAAQKSMPRNMDTVQLPAGLRALRVAAGLSQDEVADYIGVSHSAVSTWELGKHVTRRVHAECYARLLRERGVEGLSWP